MGDGIAAKKTPTSAADADLTAEARAGGLAPGVVKTEDVPPSTAAVKAAEENATKDDQATEIVVTASRSSTPEQRAARVAALNAAADAIDTTPTPQPQVIKRVGNPTVTNTMTGQNDGSAYGHGATLADAIPGDLADPNKGIGYLDGFLRVTDIAGNVDRVVNQYTYGKEFPTADEMLSSSMSASLNASAEANSISTLASTVSAAIQADSSHQYPYAQDLVDRLQAVAAAKDPSYGFELAGVGLYDNSFNRVDYVSTYAMMAARAAWNTQRSTLPTWNAPLVNLNPNSEGRPILVSQSLFYSARPSSQSIPSAGFSYNYSSLANGYPPNEGFLGRANIGFLSANSLTDRYGSVGGRFLAPLGTPFEQRGLPPESAFGEYHAYQNSAPLAVFYGPSAPAFGQTGGGTQYRLLGGRVFELTPPLREIYVQPYVPPSETPDTRVEIQPVEVAP